MIAPACRHEQTKRHGRDRNGNQRFRCTLCGKTWIERRPRPLGNMRIPKDKAVVCLKMLLEDSSIRATERIVGVNRNTLLSLLTLVGERCQRFWFLRMRGLPVKNVQCDEIWGYVGCKKKTQERLGHGEEVGDAYCFTAIERDTKLLIAWHLGKRTPAETRRFTRKLKGATTGRFQVTTDGYVPYRSAMELSFGQNVDFAQLVKIYAAVKGNAAAVRYSPGDITGIDVRPILGRPDKDRICTSHAERHNLSIRMHVRRMTRLTNAFSKKWENHEAHLAIFFVWYNFCRVHQTLRTTPAVAAGLADHPWTVEEMLTELATLD